jgi:PAS domain S-box-containing protein
MLKAPIPDNDQDRILCLQSYKLLDTLPEAHFDEITNVASAISDCKIALISLVDSERQWFKSKVGLEVSETPRDISFCGHAIMGDDIFIVENSEFDQRFCDNPLFLNEPHVRFYAGVPLKTKDGHRLGTLCVMDSEEKKLDLKTINVLKSLAKQVVHFFEYRKESLKLKKSEELKSKILQSMHEGMVIQDATGMVKDCNQAALDILGLTEAQLFQRDSFDPRWKALAEDGSSLPGEKHPAMQTLKTGKVFKNAIMGIDVPDFGKKWISINTLSLGEKDERQVLATFQDVTEILTKKNQLQFLFDAINAHTIVIQIDLDEKIVSVNKKYFQTMSNAEKSLKGCDLSSIPFIAESLSKIKDWLSGLETKSAFKAELCIVGENHKLFWFDVTVNPLKNDSGEFHGVMLFLYEITEKKNALISLASNEAKFRSLFDQSQDAIMTLDPPMWKFTSCNPSALKLFNVDSVDVFTSLGPWNFSPERQADGSLSSDKAKKMITLAMEKGNSFFEWTHQTITGQEIPCTVLLSRITEDSRFYLQATVRDISSEKKLKQDILESKTYLDLALQGSDLGIWDWKLSDNSVKFDYRWARMIGYELHEIEMSLKTWENRVHPDDLARCYEDIKKYLDGKTDRYENIHRMKHKNGKWVYILDRGKISGWDEAGKPIRFTGTHLDVTQAEVNKLKMTLLYQNSPFGFAFCDFNGLIIDANKKYQEITGYSLEELKQLTYWDLTPEKYKAAEEDQLTSLRMTKAYGPYRKEYRRKDKTLIPVELNGFIVNDYGGAEGVWSVVEDISDKLKKENELNEQKKIASHQAKLASIGELAAGVGHEINNPLAIIKGYLSIIEGKLSSGFNVASHDLMTYVTKINSSTERIAKIVQGLRTFARTDSALDTEFSPLEALVETYNLVNEIYKKDSINVSFVNKLHGEKIILKGNRGKFQQLLMNLISNAKDAIKNRPDNLMQVTVEKDNQELVIKVSDNGQGIPENIREKIFEPFFTTKELHQGTGIGLSFVYNFVKELNGTVTFESELEKGTTFIVRIPFHLQSSTQTQQSASVEKSLEPIKLSGNVLLVDDEEDIRELMSGFLEARGFQVSVASNGQEALEMFIKDKSKFQIIISDMKMPIMDGIALLKAVRSFAPTYYPRFFFITGGININFEDESSDLNKMINGYFFKPFNFKKIFNDLALK